MATMDFVAVLRDAMKAGASDVHLLADRPVAIRVDGEIVPMPGAPIFDTAACTALLSQFLSDSQRARFEKTWSVDSSFAVDAIRFRINVAVQRNGLEIVIRVIPSQVPLPEDLGLPASVIQLTEQRRGMILVTGPAGAGKSTTLASLLERINQTRRGKIITVEDPIEFVYTNKRCWISQREVGVHTPDFHHALRTILRQDPDVVLVGEMRDLETIEAALQIADSGHLVLATMHSISAPQAVERIIDVFPSDQQLQVRSQLATVLRAVIAQSLMPRASTRGRVAAYEVMMVNQGVAALIRSGRTHEIANAIEMGTREGMRSLSRSLADLASQGLIDSSYGAVAADPNAMLNRRVGGK
jgi:twitching motility protein PilT